MKVIIKKIFIFLIPTLIVALFFALFNQQNFLVLDDSDYVGQLAKIDAPAKRSNSGPLLLNLYFLGQNDKCGLSVLAELGGVIIFIYLLDRNIILCNVRNRSPPINLVV